MRKKKKKLSLLLINNDNEMYFYFLKEAENIDNNKNKIINFNEQNSSKYLIKVKDFLEIGKSMKKLFKDDIKRDFRRNNYILYKNDFAYYFNEKTHSKLTLGNVSIFYNEIKQAIDSCNIEFKAKINVESIPNSNPQKFRGIINISTNLKNLKNKFSKINDLCNSK